MKEACVVSFLLFLYFAHGFIRRVYTYRNNEYEIQLMKSPEQRAWLDVEEDGVSHFMHHS